MKPINNTPSTPQIGTVNTGAKDVPDVNAALSKLFTNAKTWSKDLPAGSKILGQLQIGHGVDVGQSVLLVQTGASGLQLFAKNAVDAGIITRYAPLGKLGQAVSGHPKTFLAQAKGHEPLYTSGTSLKQSGYHIALTQDGGLFLTQPRSNTILHLG